MQPADRAQALERLGDPATADAALAWFRARADAAPDDAQAWFDLAGAYDALDRESEAEAAYRKVRALGLERLRPEDRPRWHVQMGSTLRLLGRLEESREVLAEGLQVYPDNAALAAFAALTELAAGEPAAAAKLLMQALLASADPSIAHYHRALAAYAAELTP